MRSYFFLLAFPCLLAGQAPPSPAVLEGMVVDAATRQPVSGARLSCSSEAKAVTGADGHFRIAGLQPGTCVLSTRGAPFLPAIQRITLDSGQTLANWQVELARPLEVSGKVEDQDGWPAEGCTIEVVREVYRDGRRILELRGSRRSNDLGEYWIGGLEPGRYYVRARPSSSLISWDDRYGITYHPAVESASAAEAVDLVPGEQPPGANIRMLRRHGVRLSGEVAFPDGVVLFHAATRVSLDCQGSYPQPCIEGRFANGAFTINDVPPGSYILQGQWGPIATSEGVLPPLATYQHVEVGTSNLDGLVLNLQPQTPHDVAAAVTLEPKVKPEAIQFSLQQLGGNPITEQWKPDGSLVFHKVLPGRYRWLPLSQWRIEGEMFYLKAARLGEEDILGRDFEIPNEPGAALQLTLGAVSMASVQGVVSDAAGQPAGEATVAFVPTDERFPFPASSVLADQHGAFTCSAPEGEYRVSAWRTAPPADSLSDPEFLPARGARTIVLKAGANQALRLSLAR